MTKLFALTLTLAALPLAACGTKAEGSPAPAPRPVRTADVQAQEAQGRIRYSVSVQPYEQVAVAFRSGGYIADVMQRRDADGRFRALQPGDQVSAGTVLARVREADYQQRLNQAQSSLRELEASLQKAQLDWERARTLFAADSLTRPELDAAKAGVDASLARLDSGRAQVELARLALEDCAVTAPFNGVVLDRRIEKGTLVGAGSVAFVLGRVADVKATFGVPDSLVERMTPGQPVTITTEAFQGSSFPGSVTGIAPSADPQSRVFNIEVTIPNRDGRLKPGMIGTIEVPTDMPQAADAASGIAIPLAAVVRSSKSPNGYSVFVVEGNSGQETAHARPVELGPASGNNIVVTGGVSLGEHVVVMGATLLTDGETVRVIP